MWPARFLLRFQPQPLNSAVSALYPTSSQTKRLLSNSIGLGCLGGLLVGAYMRLATADWAASGQSIGGRFLDRFEWLALGFAAGAAIGAVGTLLFYLAKYVVRSRGSRR